MKVSTEAIRTVDGRLGLISSVATWGDLHRLEWQVIQLTWETQRKELQGTFPEWERNHRGQAVVLAKLSASAVISFEVHAVPAPQGSHKAFAIPGRNGGRPRAVVTDDNEKTKPWRRQVAAAYAAACEGAKPLQGAVEVTMVFRMPRPKWHYGTGKNAGKIKSSAPVHCITKPDVDKLQRSTFDALTLAGAWVDDAQAVVVYAAKIYVTEDTQPGATIILRDLEEQ